MATSKLAVSLNLSLSLADLDEIMASPSFKSPCVPSELLADLDSSALVLINVSAVDSGFSDVWGSTSSSLFEVTCSVLHEKFRLHV